MERAEYILNFIEDELSTEEIVYLHDEYCGIKCYPGSLVYAMEHFDEMCEALTPRQIAGIGYEGFNPQDKWFTEDIYGFSSFSDWIDCDAINIAEIAEYIAEKNNPLCCEKIKEFLVELDEKGIV